MSHRIRLGPPWEVAADGTRYLRRFGRPRTLDAAEQVWLVCGSLPEGAEISVNGMAVGTAAGGEFAVEITSLLRPRNELAINLPAAETLGDIALEIRDAQARVPVPPEPPFI